MPVIPMVDLRLQYQLLKEEIDRAVLDCLEHAQFIGGPLVKNFEEALGAYLQMPNVITCANGTDALQLALMVLDLPAGSKVIVPAFTYIAPVEVIQLLGLVPVFADADAETFNSGIKEIEAVYTGDVKAIIAVHLFGKPCQMEAIAAFAGSKGIALIEDNAQSLGAEKNIQRNSILTTSFFPSKNLGAYGDGGALMTRDDLMTEKLRSMANHGQRERYTHERVGINSRLDALQAAILSVKLRHLDRFIAARRKAAAFYTEALKDIPQIKTPAVSPSHTFHQYTLKVEAGQRDALQQYLQAKGISTAIYYPLPVYRQKAYAQNDLFLPVTEQLCQTVLSLPIYPEISEAQLSYICTAIRDYFSKA